MPHRVMLVAASNTPYDDQSRGTLVQGVTRKTWATISEHSCGVKTVRPTLLGLNPQSSIHLLAHGYTRQPRR